MSTERWYAYFVRCGDGSLYAGVTTDVAARVAAHANGTGARYTRARAPITWAWTSSALSKIEAHRLEYRLKQLRREQKELIVVRRGVGRLTLMRTLLAAIRDP